MCSHWFSGDHVTVGQVIAAEGEQKASRALKEASDVMSESSAALQLRYLQVNNTLSFFILLFSKSTTVKLMWIFFIIFKF